MPSSQGHAINVVAIGGGTGLSTLLKGFKHFVGPRPGCRPEDVYVADLTAVVTVSDDGGSSGRLRKEFNILPPGDIRNCIVALSDNEPLLSNLFQYRFKGSSALDGHNFGNLFLTAMTSITGDFAEAVRLSAQILSTRGHIYPATTSNVELEAAMDDGTRVRGETRITNSKRRIRHLELVPADVQPMPQTLRAIERADLITIGPGSLFTSLIPNVLVGGIVDAIVASRAVKVYVCNLMTQANESLGLTASQHIEAIYQHAGRAIFDYAVINTASVSRELQAKYALEAATQIIFDREAVEGLGVRPVTGHYLLEESGMARHATERVALDLMNLFLETSFQRAAKSATVR